MGTGVMAWVGLILSTASNLCGAGDVSEEALQPAKSNKPPAQIQCLNLSWQVRRGVMSDFRASTWVRSIWNQFSDFKGL
jgi:hypothetical protein